MGDYRAGKSRIRLTHGVSVSEDVVGRELLIRAGNMIATKAWSQADPLKINVMDKDYELWGRIKPSGAGFSFQGRFYGTEADLDRWIFSDEKEEAPEDGMDLGSSVLQRWISTLPSSVMSFQFNRLKVSDLDFERIKGLACMPSGGCRNDIQNAHRGQAKGGSHRFFR